jgi:hypothetical protein
VKTNKYKTHPQEYQWGKSLYTFYHRWGHLCVSTLNKIQVSSQNLTMESEMNTTTVIPSITAKRHEGSIEQFLSFEKLQSSYFQWQQLLQYYRFNIPNATIQYVKCSKVQNILSTNMTSQLKNSTPELMCWFTTHSDTKNLV